MVQNLGLKTEWHPNPYKIGWIKKDSETKVTEIFWIKFSMGNVYFNEIYYDVINMDACHMILGWPWQYDLDTTHLGRDNHSVLCRPIQDTDFSLRDKKKQIMMIEKKELFSNIIKDSEIFMLVIEDNLSLNYRFYSRGST